jgi:hypothetical protein
MGNKRRFAFYAATKPDDVGGGLRWRARNWIH